VNEDAHAFATGPEKGRRIPNGQSNTATQHCAAKLPRVIGAVYSGSLTGVSPSAFATGL
jgi:hypothetical protein